MGYFIALGRRMVLGSNLILVGCSLCWVACIMHFWRQIVLDFDSVCRGEEMLIAYLVFVLMFSLPLYQRTIVGPWRLELRALSSSGAVLVFLAIVLPFLFAKQVASGELQPCSNKQNPAKILKVVGGSVHGLIATMRYWEGSYHVLMCVLVGVVCTSFNVEVQGQDRGQDRRFHILGFSVLILAFSQLYFIVRRAEVDVAKQLEKHAVSKIKSKCCEEV